ncbi:MAG: hypothetical protein AAF333_04395 [Planctomycetota bacterium]
MPNARQISQRINELLAANGRGADTSEFASLAAAYAELTRRAHDRLARCHDLLARGLRSEAVQESDLEPSLLNMVAALEIRDFRAWDDYCHKHDLPAPSPLSRHVAGELNRAYAADQLVAPLLREYRFRCLARSPIAERIAALRGVAGLDKNNTVWNESLVLLETQRLQELRFDTERALGDIDRLRAIQRELLDDRRRVPAPETLVRRVDEGLRDTLVKKAQQELRTLLPALHEAYSAMDYRTAKRLLESWDATLKSVGQSHLHLPEDLREPVQPIMDWVQSTAQQQQREIAFRQDCARLRGLIESSASLEELARGYESVAAFDLPLPDTLGEDYRRAQQRLELVQVRRRRNRLAVAAGVVLLAAVSVGWAINSRLTDRRITQTLTEVEREITRVDLGAAVDRLEVLTADHPTAAERDDVRHMKQALDDALAREGQRRDSFEALHARIANTGAAEMHANDVAELEHLARLDEEKTRVNAIQQKLDSWRLEQRRERESRTLARADTLLSTLAEIGSAQIDNEPDAALHTLAEIRGELTRLRGHHQTNPTITAVLDTVAQREDELRVAARFVVDQRTARDKRRASLDQVIAASSSANTLAAALRRYAQNHPEDVRSRAFERAAQDAEAWRAIEAWQRLVTEVDPDRPPPDLAEVARRIRALDDYLDAHPRSPVTPAVRAYRGRLAQALLVSSDSGPWLGRLPEILRAPVIRDLNVLNAADERRYYVVGQGNRRETSLGTIVDVVLTPDITRTKTVSLKPGSASPITTSPQSRLAATLLAQIADYRLGAWDHFHFDLIETILAHGEVDTVLRGVLLTMVIDETEKTVGQIDPELQRFRKLLNAQNEDGLNWLDPDDLTAATVREHLDRVIAERLPDLDELRERIAAQGAAVDRQFDQALRGGGVLLRDDGVARVEGLPASLPDKTTVYLTAAASPDGPYVLRPLGGIEDGELRLRFDQSVGVPEGAIVFWVSE